MFVREVFKAVLAKRVRAIAREMDHTADGIADLEIRRRFRYAVDEGRRFRPLLVMTTCEGVGGRWRDAVEVACAVEILHKASLLHDDLVDGDRHRRGRSTFWNEFGSHDATITGDLLIAIAFEKAHGWSTLTYGHASETIAAVFNRTLQQLSTGELQDLLFESRHVVRPDEVQHMLYLKSGSLIASSFELGALVGGADDDLQQLLRAFGGKLGVIFQMVNDINNITGVDAASKGFSGQDFARGKKTLPTLCLIEAGIRPNELASLEEDRILSILEPAYLSLHQAKREAVEFAGQLPKGQMRQLYLKLVEHAEDKWFWVEKDA